MVSVLSKRPKGERIDKLKTYLNQVITPYKKFKKMYVVDNTTQDYRGSRSNVLIVNSNAYLKITILPN